MKGELSEQSSTYSRPFVVIPSAHASTEHLPNKLKFLYGGYVGHSCLRAQHEGAAGCQRKVEMSYSLQSRNVLFSRAGERVRVTLPVSVKRRRAMLASNPIEE